MAKGLFKLLFLIVLSAGASSLPNFLGGNMAGLPGGALSGLTGGSGEETADLSRELSDIPRTVEYLKNLDQENEGQLDGLPPEERQMMLDAMPSLKFKSNTLTRNLGLAPGQGQSAAFAGAGKIASGLLFKKHKAKRQTFSDFRGGLLDFYERHQAGMTIALWLGPAAAAAFSFLLFVFKRYTLSLSLTGLIFLLANSVIWFLSIAVVLSTALTRQSLLAALPRDLWLSPVVFLVISSGLMRLVDENYPFWNKTITTLFAPIAAACLAAGWGRTQMVSGYFSMFFAKT
jgi:hypothetical protein